MATAYHACDQILADSGLMGLLAMQAVVNEDTSEDAKLLRQKVSKLEEELAMYKVSHVAC